MTVLGNSLAKCFVDSLKVSARVQNANFRNFLFRDVLIELSKSFLLKKIPLKNIISLQSYWTLNFATR